MLAKASAGVQRVRCRALKVRRGSLQFVSSATVPKSCEIGEMLFCKQLLKVCSTCCIKLQDRNHKHLLALFGRMPRPLGKSPV